MKYKYLYYSYQQICGQEVDHIVKRQAFHTFNKIHYILNDKSLRETKITARKKLIKEKILLLL
jgi:hypothetical protein